MYARPVRRSLAGLRAVCISAVKKNALTELKINDAPMIHAVALHPGYDYRTDAG
jgi:Trk K+ transport system NAD-binding subunit